jgi:hypothetical protein
MAPPTNGQPKLLKELANNILTAKEITKLPTQTMNKALTITQTVLVNCALQPGILQHYTKRFYERI